MIRHFTGIFLLTVLVLIVGGVGIYIAGSPIENRNVRYDEIRLRDLDTIRAGVESYYQDNYQIPGTLSQLLGKRIKTEMPYLKKEPKDPKTKKGYEYKAVGATKYELCATFDTSSESIQQRKTGLEETLGDYSSYYGEDRSHPKGHYCFTKTISVYLQEQSNQRNELRYEDFYPQSTSSAF